MTKVALVGMGIVLGSCTALWLVIHHSKSLPRDDHSSARLQASPERSIAQTLRSPTTATTKTHRQSQFSSPTLASTSHAIAGSTSHEDLKKNAISSADIEYKSLINKGYEKKSVEQNYQIEKTWISGSVEDADMLLNRGVSSNWVSIDTRKDSAVEWAVFADNEPVLRKLLADGADPNYASGDLGPPVVQASALPNPQILEDLISAGADLNVKDGWGRTPLSVAEASSRVQTVELLLKNGVDPATAAAAWTVVNPKTSNK